MIFFQKNSVNKDNCFRFYLGAPFVLLLAFVLLSLQGCAIFSSSKSIGSTSTSYRVKGGDTLFEIALRSGCSVRELSQINGISNPNRIFVGQRLYLCGAKSHSLNSDITPVSYRGNGQSIPRDGKLAWPVPDGRIVSHFGPRSGSFHDGLDIAAKEGSSIFAAHDGVVIYSGSSIAGYGNLIILRHPSGLTTVYAHNRKLIVREGRTVKRKELIATVGQTGRAEGPHLHFEVRLKDTRGRYVAVDPYPLFVSQDDRPRYRVNESLTPILARILGKK